MCVLFYIFSQSVLMLARNVIWKRVGRNEGSVVEENSLAELKMQRAKQGVGRLYLWCFLDFLRARVVHVFFALCTDTNQAEVMFGIF